MRITDYDLNTFGVHYEVHKVTSQVAHLSTEGPVEALLLDVVFPWLQQQV